MRNWRMWFLSKVWRIKFYRELYWESVGYHKTWIRRYAYLVDRIMNSTSHYKNQTARKTRAQEIYNLVNSTVENIMNNNYGMRNETERYIRYALLLYGHKITYKRRRT